MNVLFATSEAYPFATSGGLGDVAASLPKSVRANKVSCRVIMPLYQSIAQKYRDEMTFVCAFSVPVAWRNQFCGLFKAKYDGITYYFIDNEYYFKRPTMYGHFDDAERFSYFSRAVLEVIKHIDWSPQVIHCNDWQTALVPVYLQAFYKDKSKYTNIKTLITIHNIEFQGKYGHELIQDVFGLPASQAPVLDYDGCLNLLKGAIVSADKITTVSPTYADEILDPWFSHGLHTILSDNTDKISGILNGIDTDVYNPANDPALFKNYDDTDLTNKKADKKNLQKLFDLPQKISVPIISMVTRLTTQKGLDLVKCVFDELMEQDIQFILLGSGGSDFEEFFSEKVAQYPGKVAVKIGFDMDLARKIYSGSDMFLMPSKFEPCGLAQLISMRYGTVPIVRSTGGLADTVNDCELMQNGFKFYDYNAHDMLSVTNQAIDTFKKRKSRWAEIVKCGMTKEMSWDNYSKKYIALYKELLGK